MFYHFMYKLKCTNPAHYVKQAGSGFIFAPVLVISLRKSSFYSVSEKKVKRKTQWTQFIDVIQLIT